MMNEDIWLSRFEGCFYTLKHCIMRAQSRIVSTVRQWPALALIPCVGHLSGNSSWHAQSFLACFSCGQAHNTSRLYDTTPG